MLSRRPRAVRPPSSSEADRTLPSPFTRACASRPRSRARRNSTRGSAAGHEVSRATPGRQCAHSREIRSKSGIPVRARQVAGMIEPPIDAGSKRPSQRRVTRMAAAHEVGLPLLLGQSPPRGALADRDQHREGSARAARGLVSSPRVAASVYTRCWVEPMNGASGSAGAPGCSTRDQASPGSMPATGIPPFRARQGGGFGSEPSAHGSLQESPLSGHDGGPAALREVIKMHRPGTGRGNQAAPRS
jgi:hypothetical protein